MLRYREAIEAINRAHAIAPGNPARTAIAGDSWLLLGHLGRARTEYARIPPDDYLRLTGEAMVAARTGDRQGAERAMARMRQIFGASMSYQYAIIYAQLGDKDRAFAELHNALGAKDPGLIGMRTDAFLDPVRDDPRYTALLRKLNFPA
jgi:tetratricopeptide (TPR) repeat protein